VYNTEEEAVQAGAAYMDNQVPGWFKKINFEKLRMLTSKM
jgi:hypothetical protein